MAFWSKLFSRKESDARMMIASQSLGQPIMTPREYDKLAKEGYNKNAVAFACVNKIAAATKSIRFVLYQRPRTKNGRITEVESHPILDLLRRPNPMMAGPKYWETVSAFMQLSGNSYTHTAGPDRKPPRELWPMRPDRVKIVPGRFGLPTAFEYSASGQKKRFDVDALGAPGRVLHIKSFNPTNDWYGISKIEAAAFAIDQHNESGKWNVALMQNSARPSGLLVLKTKLGDTERDYLKRQLEEKHTGARNAGKPLVVNGADAEWHGMSFNPKDMEWIESKNTSARDIALAFGVPPMLLAIPGDNTYSNYQEARQAFWIETVLPEADDLLAEHNNWLPVQFGEDRMYLGYDKDELDALQPSRTEVWTRVTNAKHITINEKRVATGYDERPEPEADEILVSAGDVPLTFESEPEEESTTDTADLGATEDDDSEDQEAEDDEITDDEDESGDKAHQNKVFNLPSTAAKRRQWLRTKRRRSKYERRMAKQLRAVFEQEAERVASAVSGLDGDLARRAAETEILDHAKVMERVISSNLRAIGQDFGGDVLKSMKSIRPSMETKASEVRFESILQHWIALHAAAKVRLITENTVKKIRQAMQETQTEGEGAVPLSKRIEATYSGFSKPRAMLIARTETVSASNASQVAAAKATGVPNLKKEWLSSPDDGRARDGDGEDTNHQAMDGVKVGIDEKFEVPSHDGTDHMDQPGDPSAPVDQIANCRCTVAFVTEGDE